MTCVSACAAPRCQVFVDNPVIIKRDVFVDPASEIPVLLLLPWVRILLHGWNTVGMMAGHGGQSESRVEVVAKYQGHRMRRCKAMRGGVRGFEGI